MTFMLKKMVRNSMNCLAELMMQGGFSAPLRTNLA